MKKYKVKVYMLPYEYEIEAETKEQAEYTIQDREFKFCDDIKKITSKEINQ